MAAHDAFSAPIGAEWHSAQREGPFQNCDACGCQLGLCRAYAVMKSWQRDECVCELAVCWACIEKQRASWSEESREAFTRHQVEQLERFAEAGRRGEPLVVDADHCDHCGKAADRVGGVVRQALCRAGRVVFDATLCLACEDAQHQLLSPETREEHDRFMASIMPGPPSIARDPEPLPVDAQGLPRAPHPLEMAWGATTG